MAKLNLLDIVNDIANDCDTEYVNSIDDTVESVQIAQIVKTSYFELIASRNWPHLRKTAVLDSVSDLAKPTHLKLPEGTKELVKFCYNRAKEDNPTRRRYEELQYMDAEDFLEYTNLRNSDNSNVVEVTDFGGSKIQVLNDQQPTYFTSFDDEYLVLDSYNLNIEDTVQSSNTQVIIYFEPDWTTTDEFIPDLPSEAFPLLIEEAKSNAYLVLRQQPNAKAEQRARRQNIWLSRRAWRTSGGLGYPDYGRKS